MNSKGDHFPAVARVIPKMLNISPLSFTNRPLN